MFYKMKFSIATGIVLIFTNCISIDKKLGQQQKVVTTSQKIIVQGVKTPPLQGNDKIGSVITKYVEKNNCRVPEVSDFTFSEKALGAIEHSAGNAWIQTIALENFDNNLLQDDFAVMLINKADHSPNNFRLVFFFEQKKGYKSFEFLNHINLSTSVMSKNPSGWQLVTYHNEGKVEKSCGFYWNTKTKIIECVDAK